MASRTSAALEIRKLRKKLRQIENLERKDGDLLDEELLKVFIIHRHNVETSSHRPRNDNVKAAKNNHLHIHQNLNMRCLIIFVLFNESSKI